MEEDNSRVISKIETLQECTTAALADIRKDISILTEILKENVDVMLLPGSRVHSSQHSEVQTCNVVPNEPENDEMGAVAMEELMAPSLPACWPTSLAPREFPSLPPKCTVRCRKNQALGSFDYGPMPTMITTASNRTGGSLSLVSVVLDPNSHFHTAWSVLNLLMLAHDLILTPFVVAWDVPLEGFLDKVALASCLFWTLDMLIKSCTGYSVGHHLERRLVRVSFRYVRTWFVPDALMVTCDWMSVTILRDSHSSTAALTLVRSVKLGKLLRLTCLFRMAKLKQVIGAAMANSFLDAHRGLLRWLTFFGASLWLNHLISCCWFAIGRWAPSDTGRRWVDTSREVDVNGEPLDFLAYGRWYQYITSMHWSVAQFTLGSIDYPCYNSFERGFNMVCLVLGLIFGSTLVSMLSASMVDYQLSRQEQTRKLVQLRRFLRQNKISEITAASVQQQATQRLGNHEKIKEQDVQILTQISSSLRTDLRFEMFEPHLCSHPLFRLWVNMDVNLARRLCTEFLEYTFFRPQDDLFTAGTNTGKCYFLAVGHLTYTQEPESSPVDATEVVSVEDGSWLSEASLWSEWIHIGTAKASTTCEVLVIPFEAVAMVVQRPGEVSEITHVYSKQFYSSVTTTLEPKSAAWPSDLHVPLTDFGDLVMSMDPELQKAIGMNAITHSKVTGLRLGRARPNLAKLRQEISASKSSVTLDAAGQLERVVCVVVLRLQREDGRVLAELGKSQESKEAFIPCCQLPGVKQELGERATETLQRLFDKLRLADHSVTVLHTERTMQCKQSRELGVRTKYLRTVVQARIEEEDIGLPLMLRRLSHSVTRWPSCNRLPTDYQASRTPTPARSSVGTVYSSGASQDKPCSSDYLGNPVYSARSRDKQTVYSWLPQQHFEHLSSSVGDKELAAWLESLKGCTVAEESSVEVEQVCL